MGMKAGNTDVCRIFSPGELEENHTSQWERMGEAEWARWENLDWALLEPAFHSCSQWAVQAMPLMISTLGFWLISLWTTIKFACFNVILPSGNSKETTEAAYRNFVINGKQHSSSRSEKSLESNSSLRTLRLTQRVEPKDLPSLPLSQ